MKKIFAAILALTLLACCAFAESADITGMWYYDIYGLVATMELRADNTVTIDFVGDVQNGTYTFDGTTVVISAEGSDGSNIGIYDPETQTISVDEGTFIFGREEIIPFEPAPALADAVMEDFSGSWESFKVGTQGMYIDSEGAGIALNLKIEGENIGLSLFYGEESVEVPATGVFTDGVLTAGVTTGDESGASSSITFELRLLEDGNLAATYVEAEDMTFYLAPVTEEAAAE